MSERRFSLGNSIKDKVKQFEKEEGIFEKIVSIDTSKISNWEFRDRKDFEIGDIKELGEDIVNNGQVQPIIVTRSNQIFKPDNDENEYVVIAGYRRWLACKQKEIDVLAIIKDDFSIEAALSTLVSENKKENISDFSKGVFFKSIIDKTSITQSELANQLGLKTTTLKNFLSFSRIDNRLLEKIKDPSKISARTSAFIASLCSKGDEYVEVLMKHANKIENGIGATQLENIINLELSKKDVNTKSNENIIFSNDYAQIKHKGKQLVIKHENLNADLINLIKELVEMHEC